MPLRENGSGIKLRVTRVIARIHDSLNLTNVIGEVNTAIWDCAIFKSRGKQILNSCLSYMNNSRKVEHILLSEVFEMKMMYLL